MGSIFDKYNKFNKPKGGKLEQLILPQIEVVADEPSLDLEVIELPRAKHVHIEDHPEEVKTRIRQLMEDEAHLRNQREKYRMNYYALEREKAPQEEFAKNYAIIDSLTKQLAPIYIERKKIEQTGTIEQKKVLTDEDNLKIMALKQKKRPLIDKKSKLTRKIETYLAKPRGAEMLPQWEAELEMVKLQIYEIEEEIKSIQE